MTDKNESITMQLNDLNKSAPAQEQLFKLVYKHLREVAFMRLQSERNSNTYSVTSLVDEAYLRLTMSSDYQWENRRQFYASIATTMKRILIENARHNLKKGRENKFSAYEFKEELYLDDDTSTEVLHLNEALEQLTEKNPELAEIVQLKFFVGLEVSEIADLMACSKRSIDRKWSVAKAWLATTMSS